jgi:uncharacterized protein (TIGR02118 family)
MILTIFYPVDQMTRFDEDYYVQTHIPMAKSIWDGLLDYVEMISFPPAEGQMSPYRMITVIRFASADAFGRAMSDPRMAELQQDVAVFTDSQLVAHVGERASASV